MEPATHDETPATAAPGTPSRRLPGDVNGDGRVDIDDRRLPLIARIYGVLVLLSGIVTVPALVFIAVRGIVGVLSGHSVIDVLDLTFILTCVQVGVMLVSSSCMVVFGVFLLYNRRKNAARWAYAIIPLTIADGMLSLALVGVDWNLIPPIAQLAILTTLSIVLDPALLEERRLQRTLKRMDERSDYEEALAKGMLGRDPSGKGYIELEFFNIFWLFMIGCVFGLVVETLYHRVVWGEWQDRAGLLWGPFSPIYGCGAVVLTACLNRLWRSHPLLIFCASAVIGGAFEYFVSWFHGGGVRHHRLGLHRPMALDRRAHLRQVHGVLGVPRGGVDQAAAAADPVADEPDPWKVRYSLTAVVFVFMLVNAAMTLMAFDCWYGRVSGNEPDSPVTWFFAEHYDNAYMEHRFQTMTIDPSRSGRL